MLVDFRNDLMKNFHADLISEPKKKPAIQFPRRNHTSKAPIFITKPINSYNSMNFKTNWTLFFPYDDYCVFENITINSKIERKKEFSYNLRDFLLKHRKREKCQKKRGKQKVITFKEGFKEENTQAIAVKDGFDIDLGVESIFKVLTKHIKVYI